MCVLWPGRAIESNFSAYEKQRGTNFIHEETAVSLTWKRIVKLSCKDIFVKEYALLLCRLPFHLFVEANQEPLNYNHCHAQECAERICEHSCLYLQSSKETLYESCIKGINEKLHSFEEMMFGVFPEGHLTKQGDSEIKEDQNNVTESTVPDNASCTSTHFDGNLSQTAKNKFFIDASTLLDETEVKAVQNNKSDGPPAPPPPLIRRKTFELDADDDKVAVLRQEYERRQGNLLFQSCGTDAPLSLPLGLPRLTDDDVHTPDSLNNDIVSTEGLDNVEESVESESLNIICNDDPNRNELVSPAPSPVGGYVAIHKDSIDAGSILDDADDIVDKNHATDNGHAHTDDSEQTDNSAKVNSPMVQSNKIDAMPIVSGGVVPEKIQSPMFSRRKTECAPILSGAAPLLLPEPKIEEKPKNTLVSSLASAWVVDISDIVSSPESRRKKEKQAESKSLTSSLGFFVELKDDPGDRALSGSCGPAVMQRSTGTGDSPREWRRTEPLASPQLRGTPPRKIQNSALRQLSSEDRGSTKSSSDEGASHESSLVSASDIRQSPLPVRPKVVHSPEQKMFTMFIGLDKPEPVKEQPEPVKERPELPARRKHLSEKSDSKAHSHKSKFGSDTELSTSSADEKSQSTRKQPVYMYIGTESPSMNRKVLNDLDTGSAFKKQHTRAKSMSTSAAATFPDSRESHSTQPNSLHDHSLSDSNFVRLSDLDRAPSPLPRSVDNTTTLTLENKRRSWKPRTPVPNCSESLARLFPKLRESPASSLIGMEVEDHTQSKPTEFWQELKQMFLNNVCSDVLIEVAGRRIGAHKVVLTHRCLYFAAALSGGWVESGGNVIRLRGFSYPAVHFALYHIYVGTLAIPEHMNIVELAMLCDLFHLDSLKETVELEISERMCHMFHDPQTLKCACISGVFETLVLAASYNLEYLYPKCLHWCSSHFYKVCQSLPFVTLPSEVKDKILKTIVSACDKEDLTTEEALELKVFTAVNASRLVLWCGRSDWAHSALPWFHRLKDDTHKVVAKAMNTVISNPPSFHLLVRDSVDSVLLQSVHFLSPEELCRVYRTLYISRSESPGKKYPEGAKRMLEDLYDAVVVQVVTQASKVMKARAWDLLDVEMQTPILEKAGYPLRHQIKLQRSATDDKTFQRRERASPVWSGPNPNRLQNLKQVKQVIAQHVNRATQGTLDPVPIRRSAVPVPVPDKVQIRPVSIGTVKKREVKSRYLEMKSRPSKPKTNETSVDVSLAQRHSYCAPATATSSDSSAITPTESLSDAALDKPHNRLSVQEEGLTNKPKETKRPMSGPTKQLAVSWNAPRRCASSSHVESARSSSATAATKPVVAKERQSVPPILPSKAKRVGLTLSTSVRSSSTSASTSASAPPTASTSFSKSTPKLTRPTPPATAPITAPGVKSRLNIPLRTSRSSSSVPQTIPSGVRKEPSKTVGENATSKLVQSRPASKTAPLKPLNGPREAPKRINGFSSKSNSRTVGSETSDVTSKGKSTRTALREKKNVQTSISTCDMATDTYDIPPTPDNEAGTSETSKKSIVLASRSGTFLKDEPTVLRKQTRDES